MADSSNPLIALSDHTAQIVERAAQGVVAVHGGGRSSGIHWRSGVIVTAEEVLERDEDISVTLPGGRQVAATLAGRDPSTDVADRVLAELIPGRAATKGRTVEITRGSGGSFAVGAQVNGARVAMVLDTGASAVVLTQEAAKAAGLPLEVLNYSVNVDTANGRARAAPVTLDRVSVGGITERSVPALIAQPGQLRTNLLGMSFLNRLESWEVRGDRLLMRGYP